MQFVLKNDTVFSFDKQILGKLIPVVFIVPVNLCLFFALGGYVFAYLCSCLLLIESPNLSLTLFMHLMKFF